MSSKLHRGGNLMGTEIAAWRLVGGPNSPPTAHPRSDQPAIDQLHHQIHHLQLDLEERTQAAYRKGITEGEASARQQLAAQTGATLSRLAHSVEEISGLRQRFRHEAEGEVVQLAIAIARRVLHRELTIDSDALLGVVNAALKKIDSRELHSIRIHPDHALALRQQLQNMGLPTRVEVCPDPGLERGAVIFDTARGVLDASVQTQLAEIERGFADMIAFIPEPHKT